MFFCLSLNFKQMSLYYAPVFFCYLLNKCLSKPTIVGKIVSFARLGITVLSSFAVLWAPFCLFHSEEDTCTTYLLQVLHRQFPFSRGIFEDKVANIWYTLSVAIDFRAFLTASQLLVSSLSLTLLLLVPTCALLLTRPASLTALLLALMNSSMAFFLASFQVLFEIEYAMRGI
jgi:alpha-1,3-glucosyltransferase